MTYIPLTLAPADKNAPAPQPWAKDSQPQGIMANVKNFVQTKIGQPITDAVNSAASDIQSGMSGKGSVVDRTLTLGNGLATGTGALLAPILAPIAAGLTHSPAKGTIMDKLQNSPEFQKFAMSPTGQLLSVVLNNTGKLANIAGATAGLGAGVDEVMNPIAPTSAASSALASDQQLQSRIQDATPVYNKSMVGQNVMTPDTIDANGNTIPGKITPRVQVDINAPKEGLGMNGQRPVTTSASEHAAGTEANNIQNYPDNGTNLQKMLATQDALSTEAENMRSNLQAEDKTNPLDTSKEQEKVYDIVHSQLPPEIQQAIKDGTSLPKTAAGRFYETVQEAVDNYNGTREGKLDLRQTIDQAYKNARGKLAFGSPDQNALDEVKTDIRTSLNEDLANSTKNTDTQASLKRQSNLYNHKEVLTAKAQAESSTAFGRLEQKYPSLKTLINIGRRQGIMLPIRIAETSLGVAAVGKILHDLIYNNK